MSDGRSSVRRKRLAPFLAVVALGMSLVMAGVGPASAVEPPPPPVTPASGLPSWQGVYYNPSGLTPGSPAYDAWKAAMQAKVPPPVNGLLPSVTAPKPITAPAVFARPAVVAGGAAVAVTAGYAAGWGIGQGGLILYGEATGTYAQFDAGMCALEPILQDVYAAANFGLGPSCASAMALADRNSDQTKTYSANWQTGGGSVVVLGHADGFTNTGMGTAVRQYCGGFQALNGYSSARVGGSSTSGSSYSPGGTCVTKGMPVPSGHTAHQILLSPFQLPKYVFTKSGSPTYTFDPDTDLTVTTADPLRTPSCEITWSDGTVTTGTGQQYRESGNIPINAAGLGCKQAWDGKSGAGFGTGGKIPTKIKVSSDPEGSAPAVPISEQFVPTPTPEQRAALNNTSGSGLVLQKTKDGVTDSCMTWAADCSGWWAATSNATVPATSTGTYSCTYGGSAVVLAECGIYRFTFDVKTSTPTVTDPVTGDQEPWITAPGTAPGTTPTNPADQNSIDPTTRPGTGQSPGETCFQSWPSAPDPVSWVMWPIKCALVWAFVPRESAVQAAFAEANETWAGSVPGALVEFVGLVSVAPTSSGCTFQVHFMGIAGDAINTCEGSPMSQVALFSRIATSAYLAVAVYGKIRQQAAAMVNYNVGQT